MNSGRGSIICKRSVVGGLCLVCLLLTSGCTYIASRPKNMLRTLFFISPHADQPGSKQFVRVMDRVTYSSAIPGNTVHILQNGDNVYPAMLKAINHAKKRISCETYILGMDDIGKSFLTALTAAASRGVKVRLLIDGIGSRSVTARNLQALRKAGGEVRIFNPVSSWTALRLNNRNHRKTLTLDGRTAFIGGLNLATEYNGDGIHGWRDTHLQIDGAAALAIEKVFAQSWLQGGTALLGKDLPFVGTHVIREAVEKPLTRLIGRQPFIPTMVTATNSAKKDSPTKSDSLRDIKVRVVSSTVRL